MEKALERSGSCDIVVLLATYNGGRFLDAQVQSLLNQTYSQFHIIVRDDGSTDSSLAILKKFVDLYPHKLTLLPSKLQLGVKGNFSTLMEHALNYSYVMLCDQDDVWECNKIDLTLAKMKKLEELHTPSMALLIHTDLKVVDQELQGIHPSFWKYSGLNPQKGHIFNRIIVQNVVTGCTTMLNQALLKICLPIPEEAIMHDWWIAMAASALGRIDHLNVATINYRQHGNNTLGAKKLNSVATIKKGFVKLLENPKKSPEKYRQAEKFLEIYQTKLTSKQFELLNAFVAQPGKPWTKNRYHMLKYKFFKCGLLRNAAQFLFGIGH